MEKLFGNKEQVQNFARKYLSYITELLNKLDEKSVALFIEELEDARKNQNTVFFIGNGGSAVTASHMANDLALGSRSEKHMGLYRTVALTDNTAKMTAIANDHGYDKMFIYQLKVQYRPGDKLVAITASGNSPNIIKAAEWVKGKGGRVIGLVGFDGGKLKDLCDVLIHVITSKGEYGPVEDVHMVVNHLIYTWLHHRDKIAKINEDTFSISK